MNDQDENNQPNENNGPNEQYGFNVLNDPNSIAGRSAAWLARLPWEQEVGRSNRLAPTIFSLPKKRYLVHKVKVRMPV